MFAMTITIYRLAKRHGARCLGEPGRRLHRDDAGAGYSVSVVMMLPLYMLFMGMMVEVNLLLNSHHALSTATQVAGHSVRAWLHHREALSSNGLTLEQMVQECVARNMLPFAVALPNPPTTTSSALSTAWLETGMSSQASQRYTDKLEAMRKSLRVKVLSEQRETDGLVVQLEYDSPLYLQVFEPVLANTRIGNTPARTITAKAWIALPDDDADVSMPGIPFDPLRVTAWRKSK